MTARAVTMQDVVSAYLDVGLRSWIKKTAWRNAFRVCGFDAEDLVQEGYLCFYKVMSRYVGTVLKGRTGAYFRYLPTRNPSKDNKKHFTSLVKVSFLNRITSLERKYPVLEVPLSSLVAEPAADVSLLERLTEEAACVSAGVVQEGVDLSVSLRKAPKEIKQLFELLVNDGLELTGRRKLARTSYGRRLTTDERLSALLGLESPKPIRKMVSDYFAIE